MKRGLLIVCALIFSVIVCGCAAINSNTSKDVLPSDKYVAIEEYMSTDCTLIEGTYPLPPHITLPVAFYYDGSLTGSNWADGSSWQGITPWNNYYPAVNDSFKVLYGTIYYRDVAPTDTRTGLRVRGIYGLPYALQSGFSIDSIDNNGTIFGTYNNTSIILKVGDQWTTPVFTVIKSSNGTDMYQKPYSYLASFNTTWTISNLGILDKTNISRYNNTDTATGSTMIFGGADPSEQ